MSIQSAVLDLDEAIGQQLDLTKKSAYLMIEITIQRDSLSFPLIRLSDEQDTKTDFDFIVDETGFKTQGGFARRISRLCGSGKSSAVIPQIADRPSHLLILLCRGAPQHLASSSG